TSHNTIHHLHHLARYAHDQQFSFDEADTVVEWGGGYGNLAKLYRRLAPKGGTYIIFDVPLLSCVQWLYLSTTLGENAAHLITKPNEEIVLGKINLVPTVFRDSFKEIRADLFISTWALSESGRDSQDYVVGLNWYGAKRLLLAYSLNSRPIPDSERIGQMAKNAGASITTIPFRAGNYYVFR
ncbi:MAG: hypothetical protein JXN60_07085, partial [Lentisphaerae bacterium]|nr:hypothetical protein [Lentisphaerota bacterium]